MAKRCLAFVLIAAGLTPALAQQHLYVALNNSKGYVVGARLQQSGIFRYDGDTTWTHIGWNHPSISGIAFADSASGTIHVSAGNGEMRSFDGGKSWKITTGWEVTEAQHIALDRFDRDRVYLATSYGIWLSLDDGETWRQSYGDYTQAIAADVLRERRAIAATEGGLQLTENGGDSWRRVGPATPMIDVAESASQDMDWIAGSRSKGVLRSLDGGLNWTIALALDSTVTAVAIDPANVNHQAAATWGLGLYVSTDGGKSWTARRNGLPTRVLVKTIFDANGSGRLWAATGEEGIFYSDDLGRTWAYAGMPGTMVFDMVYAE